MSIAQTGSCPDGLVQVAVTARDVSGKAAISSICINGADMIAGEAFAGINRIMYEKKDLHKVCERLALRCVNLAPLVAL